MKLQSHIIALIIVNVAVYVATPESKQSGSEAKLPTAGEATYRGVMTSKKNITKERSHNSFNIQNSKNQEEYHLTLVTENQTNQFIHKINNH